MGRREPGLNVLVLRRGEREPLEPPGGLMLLKPQHRSADAASRVHQARRTRRGASCLVSVVSGCCGFEASAQLPVKELVVLDLLSVRTRDRARTRVIGLGSGLEVAGGARPSRSYSPTTGAPRDSAPA